MDRLRGGDGSRRRQASDEADKKGRMLETGPTDGQLCLEARQMKQADDIFRYPRTRYIPEDSGAEKIFAAR